jgi:microcystin-dependent protein
MSSQPFLGELKIVSFNYAPKGWALCNGQLLPINQNQALFSLLGTTYGGDGRTTFGLPNMQGRAPVHVSSGILLGELGGESAHTLIAAELASHTHSLQGSSSAASASNPSANAYAVPSPAVGSVYANAAADTALAPSQPGPNSGGQAHDNMQPYLVLNFVIALRGIFPSRN